MRHNAAGFLVLAMVVLRGAGTGAATQGEADALAGPAPGGVTGKVMNRRGEPVPGVKVTLRLGEWVGSAVSDDGGEYCFCHVRASHGYVLELEKEGFAGFVERDLAVGRGKLAVRNVILEPLSRFEPAPRDPGGR